MQGRIIDATTREPIANATASIEDYGMAASDAEGNFTLENMDWDKNLNMNYGKIPQNKTL